ncbi:hypothetical protein [Halalkalibacter lacteus]
MVTYEAMNTLFQFGIDRYNVYRNCSDHRVSHQQKEVTARHSDQE